MQLVVHPAALLELDDALEWSRREFGPAAAARFRQRIDAAGRLLLAEPGIGSPAPADTRKLPLTPLPYTLVYRVQGEVVHVLAVMHQSRSPDYWTGRR
jgi:toxin ParE1/3/4